eukprot:CAMPEP_0184726446 /NCGR_PEP_ID=MMETSP0314-20130426/33789_1 /TAXON_ID=38298 /ORGANISM="Rhodella maculata, Strain CCMP 736" /LENGTH=81 /DNA_ID=CAMNT_0027191865 /DNA_START=35 /DNA_END=276 /DNA_ORIENTATION=+
MTSTAASSPTTSTVPFQDLDSHPECRNDLALDTDTSLEAALMAAESPRTVMFDVTGVVYGGVRGKGGAVGLDYGVKTAKKG